MKKLLIVFMLIISAAFASDKVHVEALSDFNSQNPVETMKVKVLNDAIVEDITLKENDTINLKLEKIKDPKRGKRSAKAYFEIVSYETSEGIHEPIKQLSAKYAKTSISKEEIKKIPPKKVVKTTAGAVGSYFVKGFSYGLSFADGLIENPEGNRLKSGVKQVYDDSFLSFVEYGEEIQINTGDSFYLIVTSSKNNEDENKDEIEDTENKEIPAPEDEN